MFAQLLAVSPRIVQDWEHPAGCYRHSAQIVVVGSFGISQDPTTQIVDRCGKTSGGSVILYNEVDPHPKKGSYI
jgi:hypothetical protein